MAKKKRRDQHNPNTVLVIFLVLMFLTSVGFGLWGYNVYGEQEQLIKATKEAVLKEKSALQGERYAWFLARDTLLALGHDLDAAEMELYDVDRKEFFKDGGLFKNEKSRDKVLNIMKKHWEILEGKPDFDPEWEKKKYPGKYTDKIKSLADALVVERANNKNSGNYADALKTEFTKILTQNQTNADDLAKKIDAEIAAAVAARKKLQSDATANFKKIEDEFIKERLEIEGKVTQVTEEKNKVINELELKIQKLQEDLALQVEKTELFRKQVDGPKVEQAAVEVKGGFHALMLDISSIKPLWDRPVGKVVRVAGNNREVVINLGSNHGVKEGLTFNVFGGFSRASKSLKGTIEVVKVEDGQTALARITSLYQPNGDEILLYDQGRGRPLREGENPIKENDLLFHLFWGTHVAVAGNIYWNKSLSLNPSEQQRNFADFIRYLEDNGVIVDAYVDLAQGQIKGVITPQTSFLIVGEDLPMPKAKEGEGENPMPPEDPKAANEDPKAEDPKKEEMPKGEEPKLSPQDRIGRINQAIGKLRLQAMNRGMFVISSHNFMTVTGYRHFRGAGQTQASGIRPSQPSSGSGLINNSKKTP